MTTNGSQKIRSFAGKDEAPEEISSRRGRQGTPDVLRMPPAMPLAMTDLNSDLALRFRSRTRLRRRPRGARGSVPFSLAALLLLGGLGAGAYLLKTYPWSDAGFRVEGTGNIEATGLTEVSRAEMLAIFGEDIGRNVFFVPLHERRRQIEAIPWVEHATVMRLLPDRIRVQVVERKPVAFVRVGTDAAQQVGLADANGVLLSMPAATMAQRHYSFPVVTGIDPHDPADARKARIGVYLRLLAELDSTGEHLSEQISEIDLSDPQDARVLMPEPGADILAHFGADRFLDRYRRYKAHIGEWRQQYPRLAAVDLRYDQQVVLKMGADAAVPQAVSEEGSANGAQAGAPTEAAEPTQALVHGSKAMNAAAERSDRAAGKPRKAAAQVTVVKDKKQRAASHGAAFDLNRRKTAQPAATLGQ